MPADSKQRSLSKNGFLGFFSRHFRRRTDNPSGAASHSPESDTHARASPTLPLASASNEHLAHHAQANFEGNVSTTSVLSPKEVSSSSPRGSLQSGNSAPRSAVQSVTRRPDAQSDKSIWGISMEDLRVKPSDLPTPSNIQAINGLLSAKERERASAAPESRPPHVPPSANDLDNTLRRGLADMYATFEHKRIGAERALDNVTST